ncbi:hypothetical protein ROSEINA2194_03491, partial [Roseburia inulinivorans DSM 16841]
APFLLHNMLNILAISRFNCPYISFLRYFGANNNVILTIPFRSVYKELHADHETGAADNK